MSNNPDTGHVRDEALTSDEQTSTVPGHHSRSPSTHDPIAEDADPTPALDITPGAAQPRFLGAALYSDQPDVPHSYVSSQSSFPVSSSVNNSSGYALNPNGGNMGYKDDPHSRYQPEQPAVAPLSSADQNTFLEEKTTTYANRPEKSRRKLILWVIIAGLSIVLLVVLLLVYFLVIKPKNQTHSSGSKASSGTSAAASPSSTSKSKSNVAITGGDGSTVTTEDGSTFVYRNSFGGYWHYDENDPFNNGARAQSWSPALNETFRYGIDQIRG